MSKSNYVVPKAKEALNRFKIEAANEVGVDPNQYRTKHRDKK
jgi:hypothetical protein